MESMFIDNLLGALGALTTMDTLLVMLLGVVIGLFLAFIMAPIMEYNLIHALMIHRGDFTIIFKSPICVGILAISLYSAIYGYIREKRSKKRNK